MLKYINTILILAVIVYLFYETDYIYVIDSFFNYSLITLVPAFLCMFFGILILSLRWKYILNTNISLSVSIKSSILALGVNNILPAKLGEISKSYYLRQYHNIPISESMPMMIIERVFDLIMLASMLILIGKSDSYEYITYFFLFISIVLYILVFKKKFCLRFIRKIKFGKVKSFLNNSYKTVIRIKKEKVVVIACYSICLWTIYFLTLVFFESFATDFNLTFSEMLVVFVFSAIGMAVPSTPGGLGFVQAGCVFSLMMFGVTKEEALSFGLIYHMIQYLPTTFITIIILVNSGFKLKHQ